MTPRRYVDAGHARRVAGNVYGGAFRDDPDLVARTFRHVRFASRGGYYLQLAATFGWTSLPWLLLVRQPTLIMAGADDPLIPTANARLMQMADSGRTARDRSIAATFFSSRAPRSRRASSTPFSPSAARAQASLRTDATTNLSRRTS